MSAKTMTTAEKEEAPLEKLKKRVEDLQKSIDERNESIAASQQLQTRLATERETLVLPARVAKDADAQRRLRAIDAQLVGVRQEISDDATAIAELGVQLTTAEQAVELEEWEQRRAEVRGRLIARMNRGVASNLQKLARDLKAGLDAAEKADKEIKDEISKFQRNVPGCGEISLLHRLRKNSVMRELMKSLWDPRDFVGQIPHERDMIADEEQYLGDVLNALDRLELVL